MGLTIGVDIGGTKIAAGVVDATGMLRAHIRVPTPNQTDEVVSTVVDTIRELARQDRVDAVGVGVPGLIDLARSRVLFSANLDWVNVPLRSLVEDQTELPTLVEDDANAAAWGESRFGAGQGYSHVLMVTVGTGIGGGAVTDGHIQHGASGCASDVGHMRMVDEGLACGCGRHGCWEQYASGRALLRETRRLAAERPTEAAVLLGLGDGTPEGVEGAHITLAAQWGDPVARAGFEYLGGWLGLGLADLTAVLDPACFVIGGGVAEAGHALLDPVRTAYEQELPGRAHRAPAQVHLAQLGNDAGLIGAADLARSLSTG